MPGEQKMTDQEVIATWMEPKPTCEPGGTRRSGGGWWYCHHEWEPRPLTLNECHLVEAKLSDEQWDAYGDIVFEWFMENERDCEQVRYLLHATAEQKIRALASVLRPVVEGK